MGVCFQLSKKGVQPFTPEKLSDVDNVLCEYLGVEPDKVKYHRYWVDTEGFALACGKSFDWMRENHDKNRLVIIDFLDRYYDCDNWRE